MYYGYPDNIIDNHKWEVRHDCDHIQYLKCSHCGLRTWDAIERGIFYYYPPEDVLDMRFLPPCKVVPNDCYVVKLLICKRCKNVITRPDGACVYGCGAGADENPVVLRKK